MLFAHGPAGFLTAYFTRKIWKADKLPKRTQYWMYAAGFIGGLFPDIDLFYYYLGSARISHRQLFTHSLVTYVLIFLIIYLIGSIYKKQSIKSLGIVFFFANLSHLLLDMVCGTTALFAPISDALVGLPRLGFLQETFYAHNGLLTNFIIESSIIAVFFIVLIPVIVKQDKIARILRCLAVAGWMAVVGLLIFMNSRVLTVDTTVFYADDHFDRDGDGIVNIEDGDLDGDGIPNAAEIMEIADEAQWGWYDITEGGLLEIPYRLGFHNDISLIITVYQNIGLNLDDEMTVDYYVYPGAYSTTPEDPRFERNKDNLKAWLDNKGRLYASGEEIRTGDVIFFRDGQVALALGDGMALRADRDDRWIIKEPFSTGEVAGVGRVLNIEQD